MSEDQGPQVGEVIAGRYEIRQCIGVGGMGSVHEVEHQITKRVGALKMLHPEFARVDSVVERFIREASAAGRIGSPHIIETFDAGQLDDGIPYIFMELLQGRNLEDMVEEDGPMSPGVAVDMVRQACRGLVAAHQSGIVHRDIKPENLFVVDGPEPLVKILDFGISKFDPALTNAGKMTVEGQSIGTPHYMSPEQVMGSVDIDGTTDIYSLGVTLYFLLTGELPFIADTLPAMSVLIHKGDCATVAQHRPEIPLELSEIVARSMSVNREDRFNDMNDFSAALSPFSEHENAPSPKTRPFAQLATDQTVISDSPPTPAKGSAVNVVSIPPQANMPSAAPRPPQDTAPQDAAVTSVSAGTHSPVMETLAGVPKAGGKTPIIVAGAAVLLVIVGAVAGSKDTTPDNAELQDEPDAAESASAAEPPPEEDKPAEAEGVAITVTGAPEGAKVSFNGALVTANPFRVDSGSISRPLVVEAEGFESYRVMVEPSSDQTIKVEMDPTAKPAIRSPAPAKSKAASPSPTPKPAGDLKKGRLGSQFTSEFE